MILECPECHAKFMVADALLAPAGRTVRCGSCTHSWFVTPPAASTSKIEVEAPEPSVVTEDASFLAALSAITSMDETPAAAASTPRFPFPTIPVRPFKIAAPVLAGIWFILAFITYSHSWNNAPLLSAIYRLMGDKNTSNLAFTEVRMEHETEGPKTRFILSGSIVNRGTDARTIPSVRVALKNTGGESFWTREYPVNKPLAGGEAYPFKIANVETTFASDVQAITLDMGNGMQLMVR